MDAGEDDNQTEPRSSTSSGAAACCSICFELVLDYGTRSVAKLQCSHEFHLDCIGSAFNMKGAMQCPNCRNVEHGQWLFPNGFSHRHMDGISLEDWLRNQQLNRRHRYRRRPSGESARVASPLEEVEPPSAINHELSVHNSNFVEPFATPPMTRPLVAYDGQVIPVSSTSNDSVEDPSLHENWNGPPECNEMFNPHAFPAINTRYNAWGHGQHSLTASGSRDQSNNADLASDPPLNLISYNGEPDARTRTISVHQQVPYGHSSIPTIGSSQVSLDIGLDMGTSTWTRESMVGSYAINHQQQSNNLPAMPLQSDDNGSLMIMSHPASGQNPQETGCPFRNHFDAEQSEHLAFYQHASYDRELIWGSFQMNASDSDSVNISRSWSPGWAHTI